MEPIRLTAGSEDAGLRLDSFLSAALASMTRSAAARLIESGQVTVNGKTAVKSCRLSGGETVCAALPDPEPIEALPQDIPLDVVYEDGDVIVVNKPAGLVVHPAPGHPDGTLVNALLHHCGAGLSGVGGALRPGIVHRIDRDTSGLIIAAKNDAAHQALSAQLQDHTLARIYEAVVVGNLKEDAGAVDAPIGRHHTDRKKMAVTDRGGKPLRTGRSSGASRDLRTSAAGWRRAEPIRFGCTWPTPATPSGGIRYTERRSLCRGLQGSAFTRWG